MGQISTTEPISKQPEGRPMAGAFNVVFDGPPSHESGRFVEVETDDGKSVRVGQWVEREDGLWALRFDPTYLLLAYSEWLDGEGLVKPDHEVPSDSGGSYLVDTRPHDQLVADFLEQRPVAEPEGRRSLHEAVQAAADALCACGQVGCDDSKTRDLLVALLDEQKENS